MKGIRFLSAVIAIGLGLAAAGIAVAGERVALVIGNGDYVHADPLATPADDARAVAEALERLEFEVALETDLDHRGLQNAFRDFGIRAASAEAALVYFAGHGLSVAGENFILPIDALLERERDLFYEALPLGIVLAEVTQASRLGLVILDAARDNPLARRLRQAMPPDRADLVGTGLAAIDNPPPNTMIALAAGPGQSAIVGTGPHSPFTEALLRHLEEPGITPEELFGEVRATVQSLSNGQQQPVAYGTLAGAPYHLVEPRPNRRPQIADLAPLRVKSDAEAVPLGIPAPVDPDGDLMIAQVTGVPWNGTVEVAGRGLLIGDALTMEELQETTYTPQRDFDGAAGSFDFLVRDRRGGLALGRLPIEVEAANQPPVVATRGISRPSIPLAIERPVDPDGDPLTIKVTAVPERGVVRSGRRDVSVGDELSPDELEDLVLEPTKDGAHGIFAFEVADSRGASVTSAFEIDIPAMHLMPRPKLDLQPLGEADQPAEASARDPQ